MLQVLKKNHNFLTSLCLSTFEFFIFVSSERQLGGIHDNEEITDGRPIVYLFIVTTLKMCIFRLNNDIYHRAWYSKEECRRAELKEIILN